MSLKLVILLAGLAALVGIAFGYFLRWIISLGQRGSMELEIKEMRLEAEEEAKKILKKAEEEAENKKREAKKETREVEEKLKKTEERLFKKEETLDKKEGELKEEEAKIEKKGGEAEKIREKNEKIRKEALEELKKVSGLSEAEAKKELLALLEKENEEDLAIRIRKLETVGQEKIEKKAKDILSSVIHRYGNSVASDIMSSTVSIPNDDIKGKIIGKEGRNIKAFEKATGVEVIVDDTPGSIILSSFDPVRRQVARLALENLVLDGRIQPARIEEVVEKARLEINKIIKEKGEAAVHEVGIYNLDSRIISILGRLYFRTSYGQNVLQHSVEMSHIAGMLAEELGADIQVAKAGALVHDIGKAVDHEIQGTHVEIGRRILQKFGADEKIVKAMQAHHEEYPYETLESIIVQVADAISGSRPGARRDTVENYLKRLSDLEKIATGVKGVTKAYAIQAGREIRVFVSPEEVGDMEARKIAREIAKKIEQDLKYPGEIKVVVIRENRITEYAR
ncbi:ribonuclease Y [Candidatus Campbellbacteria bacterium CG11_big_fil_rev_8_21_14_0_20_44_21]|uniref:Ribonuclease Y n=1 Tax=Candidatus Campbellbacteria bacterium CG22_combo_CG10-13_8_21_14_all_43_18 TaxID=1974530 RepID=A0A2H0DWN3_9BACT|nr:MAG: ribonuclease Y [Candidatus Campbellbacteria bacterium CG22_combo_CG10-13_8_21_14_all_43_18]PIR24249.1 MAG: ribonuclease Y [Candidatus Campbellbacteria bacterium CG11_big_fil_rev_8_21_14_0_20_44_21]